MSQVQRREAVYDLIQLRCPLQEALARLSTFEWPSQEELATAFARDIGHALDEFWAGKISADDLCVWAEELQGREDIALNPEDRDFLADALFQLSTPEICGPADEVALALRVRLT
ncbi:hypothetical protein IG195_08870 [Arthrobacter sp. TES]|uniref:hypothetical protein n=1 Tax=Paenarthrobacter TaxID=1742992 RepID=UPI0003981A3C|nr:MULTISPECIES: hypothetical protein [Paenarthrobacter]AMB42051.1 hypothetical protein AUT26_18915 [Arthrobacter sp. ATCC 21022]ERI35564.1 hypothetical protein M707_21105 [Arthrobacter sp. AK-YN10]QOI65125.1 hypothetical protein IG195_08870 [Arthrobacter sp. TES]BCW86119.1 hypothetical protein NicSoilE8_37920 [Arthrobacter sp. NicSoilE8]KUR62901.1 hypothetical protein JM67_20015 [Arthrobacter sp. ATCC 21022]